MKKDKEKTKTVKKVLKDILTIAKKEKAPLVSPLKKEEFKYISEFKKLNSYEDIMKAVGNVSRLAGKITEAMAIYKLIRRKYTESELIGTTIVNNAENNPLIGLICAFMLPVHHVFHFANKELPGEKNIARYTTLKGYAGINRKVKKMESIQDKFNTRILFLDNFIDAPNKNSFYYEIGLNEFAYFDIITLATCSEDLKHDDMYTNYIKDFIPSSQVYTAIYNALLFRRKIYKDDGIKTNKKIIISTR